MTRQIHDGRLYRVIEPDYVPGLQSWTILPKTCTAHIATLRVDMGTSRRSWVI